MQGALADYQTKFHTGRRLGNYILNKLAAKPGMRVLDFGCGDGLLTAQIAAAGAQAVGIDKDADFVQAATDRGLDARVLDGYNLPFDQEFDAVFSNATLHWLPKNHGDVIKQIYGSLKPGGKFVAELGGRGNVQSIVDAMSAELEGRGYSSKERNPWFFPTPEHYSGLLRQAGFDIQQCEVVSAPTKLDEGVDMEDWLRTFSGKWLQGIDATESQAIIRSVRDDLSLEPSFHKNGEWTIDYWRLRVVAQRRPPPMKNPDGKENEPGYETPEKPKRRPEILGGTIGQVRKLVTRYEGSNVKKGDRWI